MYTDFVLFITDVAGLSLKIYQEFGLKVGFVIISIAL